MDSIGPAHAFPLVMQPKGLAKPKKLQYRHQSGELKGSVGIGELEYLTSFYLVRLSSG